MYPHELPPILARRKSIKMRYVTTYTDASHIGICEYPETTLQPESTWPHRLILVCDICHAEEVARLCAEWNNDLSRKELEKFTADLEAIREKEGLM